ncbi:hypothetical protein K0M31_017411 [Melipona bicolor]|uniref:Uncharacterized protein n=1 Tax=Melipona bicolor TaxID=60889 RepID=A0AA40KSE7_9HYME|nr:hypothetical protein K0M31_017411 [Melipona bicolor]
MAGSMVGVARRHEMAATEQVHSTNRRARNPSCPSTDWRSGGVTNHEQRSQYGFRHRQQVRVPPKVTSKHGEIFKGDRQTGGRAWKNEKKSRVAHGVVYIDEQQQQQQQHDDDVTERRRGKRASERVSRGDVARVFLLAFPAVCTARPFVSAREKDRNGE